MRPWVGVALCTLAAGAVGSPVLAQRSQPGWIGISYEVRSDDGPRAREASVVITDVRRGSPADEAGLREGDRLVRINDIRRIREFRDLPDRLRLRAGDPVRIRVRRAGRDLDFRLRAGARPAELAADGSFEPTLRTDSLVEAMTRAMDSLRLRLTEVSRRVEGTPPSGSWSPRNDARIRAERERAAVRTPFEFFVFRGEEHDSLRREMTELNRLIEDLRGRESQRVRELRRASSASSTRAETRDEQLLRLRSAIEELTRRSASLRQAMAEAARETAGLDYTVRRSDPPPSEPEVRTFRPLTPYLLGSNRVAGAQVVELGSELAEYFSVDGGVLIVDVAPGTPTDLAGIVPGDVVTRLDQVSVRTVEDLRFGVSRAGETLPLTLVRRGSSIQVLLRR